MKAITAVGNKEEQDIFSEVSYHYQMAKEDLQIRLTDWDKKDVLFRSHIDEKKWPYRAQVFDPRIYTILYEKTARTLANKPRGRVIPRESGDAIGAKVINELLSFQWDDNERVDNMPMLAKWALMDLTTRKYGASFALTKWHWQRQVSRTGDKAGKSTTFYDGPNFKPLNNRDCLPNPSYSSIKNWFQHRDYLTLQELSDVNDTAKSKPIYKNLDLLKAQIGKDAKIGGDQRETNYIIKNKTLFGLQDFLGRDPSFRTLEVITEYRPDRWITFAPRHGVTLRDIPNPYDHGQIPVVMLKYYPIDDDLYGLSEIEPVEKLQRAINAVLCQYLDAINMSLYAPIKVRKGGGAVEMHTLEFGPGKKWLMNDPATDVMSFDQNITGVTEFTTTYRFLVSALQEALGETSAIVSNQDPSQGNKTATEIRDLAGSRSARDNFNQMFLGEAIKKQMLFWYKLDQQFLLSDQEGSQKVIQIAGKDAITFFQNMGLDGEGLDDQAIQTLSNPDLADVVRPSDLTKPLFPVKTKDGIMTKFSAEPGGQTGKLIIEKDDLSGNYDFIPDVGSMNSTANDMQTQAKSQAISFLTGVNPKTGQPTGIAQMIQQEGKKIKASDLFIDYMEDIGFKNADQYIENVNQGGVNGQAGINPLLAGGAGTQAGQADMGTGGVGGMASGIQAILGGQTQPVVPGPVPV